MAHHPHQIDDSGICTTCNVVTNPQHILECFICLLKFHGDCNGVAPFTTKSFLSAFKKLKNNDCFVFICPHCKTQRENTEASTLQQQMSQVLAAVALLSNEVAQMKGRRVDTEVSSQPDPKNNKSISINNNNATSSSKNNSTTSYKAPIPAWADSKRTEEIKKPKVTVCIKNDGSSIDLSKMKEVVTRNGVQISKTSVNRKNGDVYVDFPSNEQRDILVPLLTNEILEGKSIVHVKNKCPIVTIRNVMEYVDESDFIEKVKIQNKLIGDKIDAGSEFTVVFAKEQKLENRQNVDTESDNVHQVVVRVGEDIRDILKSAGDKIYIGFSSLRVFDRFYVKSCANCHKFGHYHAECEHNPCCGYCSDTNHASKDCPIHKTKDETKYKCVNCKDRNKLHEGHSSHWHNCPTYIEERKKIMLNIPYYTKN